VSQSQQHEQPLAAPSANAFAVAAEAHQHSASSSGFRRQAATQSSRQYNGGLHLQLSTQSPQPRDVGRDDYRDHGGVYGGRDDDFVYDVSDDGFGYDDYNYNDHMQRRRQRPRHQHQHNGGFAEYQALVREWSRVDRNIYYSRKEQQRKRNAAQIKKLRGKAIAYKEKRNLPITYPAPPPNSLLPPSLSSPQANSLDQPSSAVEILHLDMDAPPRALSEPPSAAASLDRDPVNASDIAEYQAAVASNPDPFGFGSVGVDIALGTPAGASASSMVPAQDLASPSNFNNSSSSSSSSSSHIGGFQFSFPAAAAPAITDHDNYDVEVDPEGIVEDDDGEGKSGGESGSGSHSYSESGSGSGGGSEEDEEEEQEPYSGDDDDDIPEPGYSARDSVIAPLDATFDKALTDDEYNFVTNFVLANADPDNVEQISSHSPALFKIPISYKDYYTLTAAQWLNDEVINYYNSLLNTRNREAYDAAVASNAATGATGPVPPRCYWMKSDFYAFLNNPDQGGYDYQRVKGYCKKRNTKKFGITDLWNQVDFVLVPLNFDRMHWAMGVVNVRDQQFEMYDSMGSRGDQILKRLQRWVIDEFKRIGKTDGPTPVAQWAMKIPGRDMVPQQRNGYDCGVFSTMFAKWRSQGRGPPFGFDQSNMVHFRHRMALDIWQHEMGAITGGTDLLG
jgi:hypothetical protein